MDADHRHELKENDLAEFLRHFGQWWGKYGNTLLIALLVVVAVFTGVRMLNAKALTDHEDAWRDLAQTDSPQGLRVVAESYKDPAVRTLAHLWGADALLVQAARPADNEQEQIAALDTAALTYREVIDGDTPHPLYALNARLGLARIAEARGDWDEAAQLYQIVIDQAGDANSTIRAQAGRGLAMLDRLAIPVVFGPDPVSTSPTTQPAEDSTSTIDDTADITAPIADEATANSDPPDLTAPAGESSLP